MTTSPPAHAGGDVHLARSLWRAPNGRCQLREAPGARFRERRACQSPSGARQSRRCLWQDPFGARRTALANGLERSGARRSGKKLGNGGPAHAEGGDALARVVRRPPKGYCQPFNGFGARRSRFAPFSAHPPSADADLGDDAVGSSEDESVFEGLLRGVGEAGMAEVDRDEVGEVAGGDRAGF